MLSVLDLKYIPWHPALLLRLASSPSQQIFETVEINRRAKGSHVKRPRS